jgi:ribosome-binding factor A
MAQGHRPDRVGDQIRETLSEMLSRGAVHDPGIGFLTITRVKVSADLQMARVFYTTLGDDKARRETARALERATPFFRRQVGARLQLRRVPELEFRFDQSIAHQDRIEQILRDLHDEEARLNPARAVQDAGTTESPAPGPLREARPSQPPATSSADDGRAGEDRPVPAHTTHDHRD